MAVKTPKLGLNKPGTGEYGWDALLGQNIDALDQAVGAEHDVSGQHTNINADSVSVGTQQAQAVGEIAATRIRLPGGTIDAPTQGTAISLKGAIDGGASAALNAGQPLVLNDPTGARQLLVVDPQRGLAGMLGNIADPLVWIPFRRANDEVRLSGTQAFTRASTATYIDPLDGLVKTAAIGTPRFERMADGGIGLLMEGASTNYLLHSQDFTQAAWNKVGCTVTANAVTGPDGALSGDTITDDTTTGGHYAYQPQTTIPAGAQSTYYIMRAGTITQAEIIIWNATDGNVARTRFDLANGAIVSTTAGTAKVKPLGGGWYWCEVSGTGTATSSSEVHMVSGGALSYTGTGTGTIHVWHAQAESLPFGTSVILTTTAAVTRAADSLTLTVVGNFQKDGNAYTIVADASVLGKYGADQEIMSTFGDQYRRLQIERNGKIAGGQSSAGGLAWSTFNIVDGQVYRCALSVDTAYSCKLYVDGSYQSTYQGNAVLGTPASIRIGMNLYGHIRNLRLYDRALTDAEIAAA